MSGARILTNSATRRAPALGGWPVHKRIKREANEENNDMTHRLTRYALTRLIGRHRPLWRSTISVAALLAALGGKQLTAADNTAPAGESRGTKQPAAQAALRPRRGPGGYVPLDRWRASQEQARNGMPLHLPSPPRHPASTEADTHLNKAATRSITELPHVARQLGAAPKNYLPLEHWNAAQTGKNQDRKNEASVAGPPANGPTADSAPTEAGSGARTTPVAFQVSPTPLDDDAVVPTPPLPEPEGVRPPGSRTRRETVDAAPVLGIPQDEFVIDLPNTLRLVLAANPTVAMAREEVREMQALQQRANSMVIPSLNAGTSLHEHQGNFQASTGQIKYIYSKSLYFGGGTRTWAAESLAIPAVRLFAHVGDAIFEPLSVRQQVAAKRFDSTATANTLLLEAVIRYFELLDAEARYQAARETERETAEIVQITAAYAQTGQGREGDANRARTEAYLMHTEVQRAEARMAVASGRLAEILSLDPGVRLRTVGGPVSGLQIVDVNQDVQNLLRLAERRRPELAAGSAAVQHNQIRLRQEQTRPLFPMVMLGYSAGSFGGGGVLFPPQLGTFRGRQDFDILAVWSLTNMGVGNVATVKQRRAELNQSLAERVRARNGIRQEVLAAYGLVLGERTQIQITQRQLSDSEQGFREERDRLLGAEALPIEVLHSVDQLGVARQEIIKAVTGYNQAQFRLVVATGTSPVRALAESLAASQAPPAAQ